MPAPVPVEIKLIPSGVPGLDAVLGGGIPAYSAIMVVGSPGAGKTTLAHQILFHNATPDAPALYFVALGEPTLKMLRYQQQFGFFDSSMVDGAIRYEDVGLLATREGLRRVLDLIQERVAALNPAFVVVDSFRGLKEIGEARGENIRAFAHELSSALAAWNATTLLLGEYTSAEAESLPEFSAADGILWLGRTRVGNAAARKLEVVKMRGQGPLPGLHTFRISKVGIEVFPRMLAIPDRGALPLERERVRFGAKGLDDMLGGGIPRGETILIAGSAGTGKTLLALHFIAEGVARGEPCVMATFEEHPWEHERKALAFGWDLADWERRGLLRMVYLRPLDLSVDEVLVRIHEYARELKARRVVINSISGFEVGLSPTDETDFREVLFRLVTTLSGEGVTTAMTTEIPNVLGELRISPQDISFLSDNVIVLRYVEIESQLRKAVMVVKMRTSNHAKELREYQIVAGSGVVVEKPFSEYSGVLSGIPTLRALVEPRAFTAGLTDQEESLMHVLLALREATSDQLAEGLGIEVRRVRAILDKLVDTGYVARSGPRSEPRYRVALVTPRMMGRRQ